MLDWIIRRIRIITVHRDVIDAQYNTQVKAVSTNTLKMYLTAHPYKNYKVVTRL